jgi:hypothetical protein
MATELSLASENAIVIQALRDRVSSVPIMSLSKAEVLFDPDHKNRFHGVSGNIFEPNILGAIGDIALYFNRQ